VAAFLFLLKRNRARNFKK